ncbi:hypothetical protein FSP39_002846 [Pinctada imbricata]|uniref:SET and MYND domain-containing protein 5 n=1 Tax=Pinctada imbricata TaxID=66713 RepID=A0AA88XJ88_PINIB|nr:hypothetical protein FSP39_002846 [Pinctada imbricata]
MVTIMQKCSFSRATCHIKLSNFYKALEDAKEARLRGEQSVNLALIGGDAAVNLSKMEDACSFYTMGLKVDPTNTSVIDRLQMLQEMILPDYDLEGGCDSDQGYSAVTLFNQEPYPGDDELISKEKQTILAKFCLEDTEPWKENVEDAEKQRASNIAMGAHEFMVDNKLEDALKEYTLAVKADPGNSILRRLRAEVLYILDDKYAALRELWAVPTEKKSLDVWKFGGQILYEINMPLHAEVWLKTATKMTGNQDDAAKVLFQKARTHRLYSAMSKDFPINIDFGEHGRSIFATKEIKTGNEVFTDLPMVMGKMLDKETYGQDICDNCATSLMTPRDYFGGRFESLADDVKSLVEEYWPNISITTCDKCKVTKYCSAECQEDAWKSHHEVLCPARCEAARKLHDISENFGHGKNEHGETVELWDARISPMLLARIWAGIVTAAKEMMKDAGVDKPTTEHWLKAKSPYKRFLAFGVDSPSKKYKVVYNLIRDIFTDCGDDIQYNITESEFNGRFFQAECNFHVFSAPVTPYHRFKDRISKLEGDDRVKSNLQKLKAEPNVAPLCGIFPLLHCMNHSCYQNVEVCGADLEGYGGVRVRAISNFKAGDELYVSYVDPAIPRKLRRAWLFRNYNFWCRCTRCEFEGDGPEECTECKKAAVGEKFPACGQCHRAWYCSVSCQKVAWKRGHKKICQAIVTKDKQNCQSNGTT